MERAIFPETKIEQDAMEMCPVDQRTENARRAEEIQIARLCHFASAAVAIDLGRSTLERNHRRKFTTQSTQRSEEIPRRLKISCRISGIVPRWSLRIRRPVQSSNCK